MAPDPKPARRVKDPGLMRLMHLTPESCALSDSSCEPTINLHHILPRSRGGDDVRANLMWLCGSGTTGHHGKYETGDRTVRGRVKVIIMQRRPDTVRYLEMKLGGMDAVYEWLMRL